jgi:hypothetical protein
MMGFPLFFSGRCEWHLRLFFFNGAVSHQVIKKEKEMTQISFSVDAVECIEV